MLNTAQKIVRFIVLRHADVQIIHMGAIQQASGKQTLYIQMRIFQEKIIVV